MTPVNAPTPGEHGQKQPTWASTSSKRQVKTWRRLRFFLDQCGRLGGQILFLNRDIGLVAHPEYLDPLG